MYFHYFVIISPWKRAGPFIWINLNPLHPRMLCAKFDWNWPSGSGEEDENVKSLQRQRRRRTMDKFWSEKLTWAFGSGELKMTKKIYVDVFVSLLLHISEGTYHRQFVKFAWFSMFRSWAKIWLFLSNKMFQVLIFENIHIT